jgi:hypothetical protein
VQHVAGVDADGSEVALEVPSGSVRLGAPHEQGEGEEEQDEGRSDGEEEFQGKASATHDNSRIRGSDPIVSTFAF